MDRTQVSSSNINSVGYDAEAMILEIEFLHGGIYQYFDVPESIFDGIINAPSAGQYFHQNIRGVYRFART